MDLLSCAAYISHELALKMVHYPIHVFNRLTPADASLWSHIHVNKMNLLERINPLAKQNLQEALGHVPMKGISVRQFKKILTKQAPKQTEMQTIFYELFPS